MIDVARLRPNHLLAGLLPEELSRMQAHLEAVTFKLGGVRYESGVRLHRLHFATTSVVSLLFVTESGAPAELVVAGREGVVGINLFMGRRIDTEPSRRTDRGTSGSLASGRSEPGVQTRPGAAAFLAAPHAGADHPDVADGGA